VRRKITPLASPLAQKGSFSLGCAASTLQCTISRTFQLLDKHSMQTSAHKACGRRTCPHSKPASKKERPHMSCARTTVSTAFLPAETKVRCAFSDRNLHSRLPLVPIEGAVGSHACTREARPCVWPTAFLSGVPSFYRWHCKFRPNTGLLTEILRDQWNFDGFVVSVRCAFFARDLRSTSHHEDVIVSHHEESHCIQLVVPT
jgi:hypothetical protein